MTEKEQEEFEKELEKLLDGAHGLLLEEPRYQIGGDIIPKELRGEKKDYHSQLPD